MSSSVEMFLEKQLLDFERIHLLKALAENNHDEIILAIKISGIPNDCKRLVLLWAIRQGMLSITQPLLKCIDSDELASKDHEILYEAVSQSCAQDVCTIVHKLKGTHMDQVSTLRVVKKAIQMGNVRLVMMILRHISDAFLEREAQSVVECIIKERLPITEKLLLTLPSKLVEYEEARLLTYIQSFHLRYFQPLCDHLSASVLRSRKNTLLVKVCIQGSLPMVEALLKKLNVWDIRAQHNAPMRHAARFGNWEIFRLLARVLNAEDFADKESYALRYSVRFRHYKIALYLIDHMHPRDLAAHYAYPLRHALDCGMHNIVDALRRRMLPFHLRRYDSRGDREEGEI